MPAAGYAARTSHNAEVHTDIQRSAVFKEQWLEPINRNTSLEMTCCRVAVGQCRSPAVMRLAEHRGLLSRNGTGEASSDGMGFVPGCWTAAGRKGPF